MERTRELSRSRTSPRFASGISTIANTSAAVEHACAQCRAGLSGSIDLAMVFVSSYHTEEASAVSEIIERELAPGCLIGATASAVIGGAIEIERSPGISILAACLPGAHIQRFTSSDVLPADPASDDDLRRVARVIGADDDLRAIITLADPFSVPLLKLVPALCRARRFQADSTQAGMLIGGCASSGREPGENVLFLDGTRRTEGAVGISIRGGVRAEAVVSQGCRAIGANVVVTGARRNVITHLGGRPALEVVRDAITSLDEPTRQLLSGGLYLGRVINEYKERFGRDDYLIRSVVGADEGSGSIGVSDFVPVGQTVRLHLRDPAAADEDLAMALAAQQLRGRPAGALLVTCQERGTGLFRRPNHDAQTVVRAFEPDEPGERAAKAGTAVEPGSGIPMAGFFAAGEIGPIAGRTYLHAQSACVAFFRGEEPD